MIAIVCGGRDYTNAARVAQILDAAVDRLGLHTIIEGAAPGADTLARDWALARRDISIIDCPADWDSFRGESGKNPAGAIRNAFMLDILCAGDSSLRRGVFVFPGGRGTANMEALARSPKAMQAGVKVYEVDRGPRVHNRHHGSAPADAVYVGRGTPWGNPFEVGKDGDRDEVCDRFEREILPALDLTPLRGKHLVCSCAPARCHADALLKAANP